MKESDIHASYRNGTLCIQVPKMQAQPQVESKHQSRLRLTILDSSRVPLPSSFAPSDEASRGSGWER